MLAAFAGDQSGSDPLFVLSFFSNPGKLNINRTLTGMEGLIDGVYTQVYTTHSGAHTRNKLFFFLPDN